MKIQNSKELGISELRKNAIMVAEAGLKAIDTRDVIRGSVRIEGNILFVGGERVLLKEKSRLFVFGVGKCAVQAVSELEEILKEEISGGVVFGVGETTVKFSRVRFFAGTHPFPSEQNVIGARAFVDGLNGLGEDDVVIFVVSGGGSTLLCLPSSREWAEENEIVRALMDAGATIKELNTVRKHLSLARGGFIAKNAYPARVISLIFSDVPSDDLQFIASGPTVRDDTTVKDAETVLAKYGVILRNDSDGFNFLETPKEDKYFERVANIIVASNKIALEAMQKEAERLGFVVSIKSSSLTGEAREVGLKIAKEISEAPARSVFLYGGETTVTVLHQNKGGRNMELALSALLKITDKTGVISLASDGRDNSDVAGAIADIVTFKDAELKKLDAREFLELNNSYAFWTSVNGVIRTGQTGSNVSDLIIAIKE